MFKRISVIIGGISSFFFLSGCLPQGTTGTVRSGNVVGCSDLSRDARCTPLAGVQGVSVQAKTTNNASSSVSSDDGTFEDDDEY